MIEETNEVKELMIEGYAIIEKIEKTTFFLENEIKKLKQQLLKNSEKINITRENEKKEKIEKTTFVLENKINILKQELLKKDEKENIEKSE